LQALKPMMLALVALPLAVQPVMAQNEYRVPGPARLLAVTDLSESDAPAMALPAKVAPAQNPLRKRRADANDVGYGDANK
jgi:hypothetical protein